MQSDGFSRSCSFDKLKTLLLSLQLWVVNRASLSELINYKDICFMGSDCDILSLYVSELLHFARAKRERRRGIDEDFAFLGCHNWRIGLAVHIPSEWKISWHMTRRRRSGKRWVSEREESEEKGESSLNVKVYRSQMREKVFSLSLTLHRLNIKITCVDFSHDPVKVKIITIDMCAWTMFDCDGCVRAKGNPNKNMTHISHYRITRDFHFTILTSSLWRPFCLLCLSVEYALKAYR